MKYIQSPNPSIYSLIFLLYSCLSFGQEETGVKFPTTPEIFLQGAFAGCEGIAFNGEGRLFVTGNKSLWEISIDGKANKVADLYSNLGLAPIGLRDILVADFGPTNAFRNDKNEDGIVWRITPEGKKTEVATGIGDPNFILVMPDGAMLISDDATNEIFRVDTTGQVKLFCTAVNHPNGLAISPDGNTLYVAQIFQNIRPVIADNRVWAIRLKDGFPQRAAKVITTTGPNGANDGLAMDKLGRLYIAANREGKILRYDPQTEETIIIAENVFGAASIAFGEGAFDHQSIFVTTTFSKGRGGKVFKINVGIEGTTLYK